MKTYLYGIEVKLIRIYKPHNGLNDLAVIKRNTEEREEYVLKSELTYV